MKDAFLASNIEILFQSKSHIEHAHHLRLCTLIFCGPMQTSSIGGCNYFLTFINDYSRITWAYFLKHKSDAFSYFQQFKALMENQSGQRIKILKTDRGGEYVSNEFINFFKTHGIQK